MPALSRAGPPRLPVQEGPDEVERAVGVADIEDAADVRVIERCHGPSLALESRPRIRV
jgi:hypothetical protein